MANNKGLGLAAVLKADSNRFSESANSTEDSYDGKPAGGVSLLEHPDPFSPPPKGMGFKDYAAMKRNGASSAHGASQSSQGGHAGSWRNQQRRQRGGGNRGDDNAHGRKQYHQGRAAENAYRPHNMPKDKGKSARPAVPFAGVGSGSEYAKSNVSDASIQTQFHYPINAPSQYSSAQSKTAPGPPFPGSSAAETSQEKNQKQGALTGSASVNDTRNLGNQNIWGPPGGSVTYTPHAGTSTTATIVFDTPVSSSSPYNAQQQSKTVPRSFAPHQGFIGRPNDTMPPPVFNLGSGISNTMGAHADPASMSAHPGVHPGLATATPHGTAAVSSSQAVTQYHQSNQSYNNQFYPNQPYAVNSPAECYSNQTAMIPASSRAMEQTASQVDVAPAEIDSCISTWQALGTVQLTNFATASKKLQELTSTMNDKPLLNVAMNPVNFPFIHSYTQGQAALFGVVKIKNIPYTTTKAEILAMLGRNAKLPKDLEEPVHVIMDKTTSKTQDAYVEFATHADAVKAIERYGDLVHKRRHPRLGQRPVELELSNQAALMTDIFPFAHGVFWDGATPVIQAPVVDESWKTFQGFVTEEEMTLLVRFVEIPHRVSAPHCHIFSAEPPTNKLEQSPFARDCPQRPYECMITTIKKFPWFCPENITIMQRHLIYTATVRLAALLRNTLLSPKHDEKDSTVNGQLLRRLFTAAMICPGFSVVQKDNIAVAAGYGNAELKIFNIPTNAHCWIHMHTLCPKPGIPVDVLEVCTLPLVPNAHPELTQPQYFIALIREETVLTVRNTNAEMRKRVVDKISDSDDSGYFGFAWAELALPEQRELCRWTLKTLGEREMAILQGIVHRALTRA